MLTIIDSERERDQNIVKAFSQEILGENEILIRESTLHFLNISSYRKEKIEIQFDFLPIYRAMLNAQQSQGMVIDEDVSR